MLLTGVVTDASSQWGLEGGEFGLSPKGSLTKISMDRIQGTCELG